MSFDKFAESVIKGGTVTDADVNEWVNTNPPAPTRWYHRLGNWLWELIRGVD